MQKTITDISNDFVSAVQQWMQWTNDNFPRSGPKSSLIHLQEEIKEVLDAIDWIKPDGPNPISEEGIPLIEYADCMICLLTAAGKSGFYIEELMRAIMNKMKINYTRKWKLNPDNTYSHIKDFDDLQYDLCLGCGERHSMENGILAALQHHCAINTITYKPNRFKISDLEVMMGGPNPLQSLYDLISFPHFKKMPGFGGASWIEKNSYRLAREMEIKQMKRMRQYIELEEDFYYKY